jgi:hypothetical protein
VTTWRKSSRSANSGQDDCVELARLSPAVGIRDSKNPNGGHLSLAPGRFAGLVSRIKRGDLDR